MKTKEKKPGHSRLVWEALVHRWNRNQRPVYRDLIHLDVMDTLTREQTLKILGRLEASGAVTRDIVAGPYHLVPAKATMTAPIYLPAELQAWERSLDHLVKHGTTIAELERCAGISVNTARIYLHRWLEEGRVYRDPMSRRYYLMEETKQ